VFEGVVEDEATGGPQRLAAVPPLLDKPSISSRKRCQGNRTIMVDGRKD
jgi:hypothetical protein